jgi:hypothetical protein
LIWLSQQQQNVQVLMLADETDAIIAEGETDEY